MTNHSSVPHSGCGVQDSANTCPHFHLQKRLNFLKFCLKEMPLNWVDLVLTVLFLFQLSFILFFGLYIFFFVISFFTVFLVSVFFSFYFCLPSQLRSYWSRTTIKFRRKESKFCVRKFNFLFRCCCIWEFLGRNVSIRSNMSSNKWFTRYTLCRLSTNENEGQSENFIQFFPFFSSIKKPAVMMFMNVVIRML